MSQTLYRKYRPQDFSDVVGQDHIVDTLQNAIRANRIAHAYLFTGPRGTGKTTVARLFATALNTQKREGFTPVSKDVEQRLKNGSSMDIIEIDAASRTSVDGIRSLKETVSITPSEAVFKVYIIDEVHMLSTSAFNALLKTLEEPPEHVIFILATTEVHKLPETILSRCQRFDFSRFDIDTIVKKLAFIAKKEKIKISPKALEMIAISASGGMRDAESLLAQVFALEDKNITEKEVSRILGSTTQEDVLKMISTLVLAQTSQALSIVNDIVKNGYNIDTFIRSLIEKMRTLLFLTLGDLQDDPKELQKMIAASHDEIENMQAIAKHVRPQDVIHMIDQCTAALQKTKGATIPRLPLEIAVINICGKTRNFEKNNKKESADPKPKQQESHDPSNEKTGLSEVNSQTKRSIARKWHKAVKRVEKEHRSLGAILESCTVEKYTDNTITLTVDNDFYKEKILQSNNHSMILSALQEECDMHIRIDVSIKQKERNTSELLGYAKQLMGGTIPES